MNNTFSILENMVDDVLETIIKNLSILTSAIIGEYYDNFLTGVVDMTNAKIQRDYGEKYADRLLDINDVIYDKGDREKFIGYIFNYRDGDEDGLRRAQLILDTEGNYIYNEIIAIKLLKDAIAYRIEGSGTCNKCSSGIVVNNGQKRPPFHPGCLCHITEVFLKDEDIPEEEIIDEEGLNYLQEWICPVRGTKQIVDIRNAVCGSCGRTHKLGFYVKGADKEFYQKRGWWYQPQFFVKVRED